MALRDIRLSPSSYAVMALLRAAGGEATPYELKQLLEKSVENFWPIPHTTFYAEPARLDSGRACFLAHAVVTSCASSGKCLGAELRAHRTHRQTIITSANHAPFMR